MFGQVILLPAYCRQYPTKATVLADWKAGKDFKIAGGPYTSIRDLEALRQQFISIGFRFGKRLEKHFYLEDGIE